MSRATRYVAWLDRNARAIAIASALLFAASLYLVAFHLPLYADFSYLLPADAPSVRAFARMSQRMPARDSNSDGHRVAPDDATRRAATDQALAELARVDKGLIERVESDDRDTRAFVSAHRVLYVPLSDLRAARDALAKQIARRANPLYIDLDDDAPATSPELDRLRAREHDATARIERSAYVGMDGRAQAIVIRTAFLATDVDRDERLQSRLDAIAARLHVTHPTVQVGFTGGVTTTVAEHRALVRGVALSSAITALLVALVLYVHLRSLRMLLLLTANIAFATTIAFGFAALTVGHLNAATAFLGAIIAGNGVNYGILLVARYLEERDLARAIAGTMRPTLVASLGAAIAYGALGASEVRGFADFALVGGIGMLVCWIASFVLLPVMLMRVRRLRAPSRVFGRAVTAAFGFRRPALVCAFAGVALALSMVLSWRYVTHDPYEYETAKLRSCSPDAIRARAWMQMADDTFGRGLAGMTSANYIAVDDPAQVAETVAKLRAIGDPVVGQISSIDDLVPADQRDKLALAAELRKLIDDAGDALPADVRALRPPDDLAAIAASDLPEEVAVKLRERDGHIGRIISVRPGPAFDARDGRTLIRFATAVRGAHAGDPAGGSLLFADVLMQIQRDGPLVTLVAAIGIVVMVVLVVGRPRRALAGLAATATGSTGMIAVCALATACASTSSTSSRCRSRSGSASTSRDPNVADRAERGGARVRAAPDRRHRARVLADDDHRGYLSLLASDNLAIRGFGLASLIGEITCVLAALIVVPAIMALAPRPRGIELLSPA